MATTTNNSKKNSRKFNLIFFIDSERTYHYKFHFIFVKIIVIFLILLIIFSIISIVFCFYIVNKNQAQNKYIITFKNDLLQYYFENNLMKNDKKKEFDIVDIPKQNTEVLNKELKKNAEVLNKDQVNIIKDSGIKIENPKIIQENESTKIIFSLSNTNAEKNLISGRVCAVISGVNEKGKSIIYKIPEKITLNSQNIPFSCKEGEQVKFSKLRPTEFIINVGKNTLNIKKVNVYFSYGENQGIVANSF